MTADLNFYFDPVCPFAWMTSKWVRMVAAQRDYRVDWRFISLRIINAHIDYDAHFPPEYEAVHTAGLELLRAAARVRNEYGGDRVGALYEALGRRIFETSGTEGQPFSAIDHGARHVLEPLLPELDLPDDVLEALTDATLDDAIRAETDEALALTGRDVGTPILHFQPPEGVAFFGPVISRLPSEDEAAVLWDHVVGLATFPGFAELKRSLRERPQLASFGVDPNAVGLQEDWHGGSRRTKK
jgi:2-hydroxychromene-2-carboxylate isomerase